jgi:uncharacterized protein (TIGR00251 family)
MTVGAHEGTIAVRVQPGARRDEFVDIRDGVLVARVKAPALEGRANRALCKLIAARVGVRASRVKVVRGERSREKLVRVEGVDLATLIAALGGASRQRRSAEQASSPGPNPTGAL